MFGPLHSLLLITPLVGPWAALRQEVSPAAADPREARATADTGPRGEQPRGVEPKGQRPGPGARATQASDVLLGDSLLHDDREGGAKQRLLALTGAPEQGFLAAWHDTRDGLTSLYVGRLAPNGLVRSSDAAVRPAGHAGAELEPALALAPSGAGAIAWLHLDETAGLRLRLLREDGSWGSARAFAPGSALERALPSGAVPYYRLPAVSVHEPMLQGVRGSVCWLESGRVLRRVFSPNGELNGDALELHRTVQGTADVPGWDQDELARGAVHVATDSSGSELVVWPVARGIAFAKFLGARREFSGLAGLGEPLRVLPDPAGGWWLAARVDGASVLRHLDPLGALEGAEFPLGGAELLGCDFAATEDGLFVLSQAAPGTPARRRARDGLELQRIGLDDGAQLEQVCVPVFAQAGLEGAGAMGVVGQPGGARLASSGANLLVAMTVRDGDDTDVYYRPFDAALQGGEMSRWNRDEACADQYEPDVDGLGGAYAVAAWTDERSGCARVMARMLSSRGTFMTPEMAIPLEPAPEAEPTAEGVEPATAEVRPSSQPAVALGLARSFLVCFQQRFPGESRLFAQVVDADGEPRMRAQAVDPGHGTPSSFAADAVGLPERESFAVVFVRAGAGPAIVEVNGRGKPRGAPKLLAESPGAARPTICRLDDGRVVVAWDEPGPNGGRVLRLALLLRSLSLLEGREAIRVPPVADGDEWEPSLAPNGSGCVLAFRSDSGGNSAVMMRFFDKFGLPEGKPLRLAPGHNQSAPYVVRLAPTRQRRASWAVAWLDEAAGPQHVRVRRVSSRRALGEVTTLHQVGGGLNEGRAAPRLAPVSTGFVGVWTDCRRSRGRDAYMKVLGHDFDGPAR